MVTIYPARIDNTLTLPTVVDHVTPIAGDVINRLRDTIIQVEIAIGTNPGSVYGTVSNRLTILENTINGSQGGGNVVVNGSAQTGQAIVWNGIAWVPSTNFANQNIQTSGELVSGPALSTTVTTGLSQLTGKLILSGIVTSRLSDPGQGVIYFDSNTSQFLVSQNGGAYAPLGGNSGITQLTGDVTAGPGSGSVAVTVIALQGHSVSNISPVTGNTLGWNGSSWTPSALNLAGGNNYVVGTLPIGNLPNLVGDVTGTIASNTVIKIQNNTVTSGALTKGQFFVATNTSNWAATTLSGDITESAITAGMLTVTSLQGTALSSTAPTTGQFLEYNGTNWIPANASAGGPSGGDLSGTYPNPIVAKINGVSVPAGAGSFARILISQNSNSASWIGFSGDVSLGVTGATTVNGIRSVSWAAGNNPTANNQVVTYVAGQLFWALPNITGIVAGGDLSGTYTNPTVAAIQGNAIQPGTLTSVDDGYFLSWVNAANQWRPVPGPSGSFSAGHDLSGTSSAQTVVGIQGNQVSSSSPVTGNSLIWSGSLWTPSALNLAGGSNYVTGVLPTGNQASQNLTLVGDATSSGGTTASATTVVAKINGTSVPSGPSANQVLVATSGTTAVWQQIVNAQIGAGAAIAYSKLNLSGSIVNADIATGAAIAYSKLNLTGNIVNADIATAAAITVNKLASGTSAQILLNNSTPTPTWTTVSGDATISSSGVVTNTGLRSISVPSPTGTNTVLTYNAGAYSWATPSTGITQLTGDVLAGPGSGSQAATVVALQNNPVQSGLLNASNDGYVLTWDNMDGYWLAKPILTSFVPSGTGLVHIVAGVEQSAATLVVNADVDPAAAIAGTKINPAFGSQNISTTGTIGAGTATFTSIRDSGLSTGIVHSDSSGNFSSSLIINADVDSAAAIVYSKLNLTGNIVNSDIATSAAIAGTKISPAFGSQNISTSGTLSAGATTITSIQDTGLSTGIVHSDSSGNFTSSAVNLASGDVTGVLSTAHQANQSMAGDVTGTTAASVVVALQTHPVNNIAPTDGYVLTWDSVDGYWKPEPSQTTFVPSGTGIPHIISGVEQPTATLIINADVDPAAAIAGTKINPAFGNQNISTTGTISTGAATITSIQDIGLSTGIVHSDASGNFTSSAVNLASADVTGILPATKQQNQTMNGNVIGTTGNTTVIAIQNNDIKSQILGAGQDGYVLTWNNSDGYWQAEISGGGPPTGPAGGDLGGNYPNPLVTGLQGNPVESGLPQDGYVLTWNSIADQWQPQAITSGSVTLIGDVTGPANNNIVVNINGASVPVSGALTTGNVLQVNGSASLDYAPIDLSNNNSVINTLSNTNQQNQNMIGDVTGTTGSNIISSIQGNTTTLGTLGALQDGYVLTWDNFNSKLKMEPVITEVATLNGDVIGLATSNIINEIQGNLINLNGILGALQDGYVLTWNNSVSKLEMAPPATIGALNLEGDVTGTATDNTVGQRKTFLFMGC